MMDALINLGGIVCIIFIVYWFWIAE